MNLSEAGITKLTEWRHNPVQFVRECIEVEPSSQQMDGLVKFAQGKRTSIMSGHGTGKDAFASWIILWFMSTRRASKVACTAPTARQLGDVLWSELSKWLERSRLSNEFVLQKDKMFHKTDPRKWWCRAISPSVRASKEEQAETLAGLHDDHLLIVVDEASGVPDPVYIPLEGALTREDNYVLLIGNPTKNHGYFYDTHYHIEHRRPWTRLHWDSRDSTNVTQSMINYFRDKYGEDSNVFRIRVAGLPPLDDQKTLISLAWAIQCVGNEIVVAEDEPVYLGVDVARYGEDKSIILPRRGLEIMPWDTFHGMNTISLGGHIMQAYVDNEAKGIAIDEIGVGAGVTDWLYKHPGARKNVFGINVANESPDRRKYDRLRDYLWVQVKEKCMQGLFSFPDVTINFGDIVVNLGQELANELSTPSYDFNNLGGIKVESKKELKARGKASPNIADALCLTEYFHGTAKMIWGESAGKKKRKRRFDKGYSSSARHSWMTH